VLGVRLLREALSATLTLVQEKARQPAGLLSFERQLSASVWRKSKTERRRD
jgi:hypothetical protein